MRQTATISLSVSARPAVWGIRLAAFLRPIIGMRMTLRLAEFAANHGMRYRVDGGRWRTLNPGLSLSQTTVLEPVDGPIAKCPDCDSELIGTVTIEHNDDGSHTIAPAEEAPPDAETAKQRVEELLKTHTAPNGAEPREDALDDPAKQEEPQ